MVAGDRSRTFARIISFIFDGSVLALPVFLVVCFYRQNNLVSVLPAFFTSVVFTALIPYLFILYLYRIGKISDLQLPKRKERIIPLIIINLSILVGFVILFFIDSSRLLKTVYFIYLAGVPVLSVITIFWKISFHSSYITMFSMIFLLVFGKWALITMILIPLVGWSRLRLKRHTLAQVLLGISVSGLISYIIIYINGYFTSSYRVLGELYAVLNSASGYFNFSFFLNNINILTLVMIMILFGYSRKIRWSSLSIDHI